MYFLLDETYWHLLFWFSHQCCAYSMSTYSLAERICTYLFLWKWTKGEQNHKISCGWGKHKWKPEEELKSRQINSFTRKGRHHISDWCKVLQAPQIRTTITCCGNAKQIQPWFGSSQGWLCLKKELQYSNWRLLGKSISTGVQLIGPFVYWHQKCKMNTANI